MKDNVREIRPGVLAASGHNVHAPNAGSEPAVPTWIRAFLDEFQGKLLDAAATLRVLETLLGDLDDGTVHAYADSVRVAARALAHVAAVMNRPDLAAEVRTRL